MTELSSLEPSIALCAYAEPLASNRRVLVFGNALGALAVQLLERGARAVHVCDANAVRAAEATARNRSTQISFSSVADSDLSLQAGAFELSLVENLGQFDAVSIVKKAKRAVGSRGVALVACPNAEAATPLLRAGAPEATSLDYYALYDVVAAEFEHVRMLGQTPFVGYAIADFSATGEPEPALDTSFVPGGAEEPDWFIALASNHDVRLDEFSVIQLPTKRLLGSMRPAAVAPAAAVAPRAPVAPPAPAAPVVNEAHVAELQRLNQWIKELESRSSTADERADHAETELEELKGKLDAERKKLDTERAKLDTERTGFGTERASFGTERASFGTTKATLDKDVAALRAQLADKDRLLTERDRQLADKDRLLTERDRQLADKDRLLTERDRQLADQRSEVEQASKSDLAELERQLVERGTEVRKLEQDVRTAERTGRELVRELARSNAGQSKAASADLDLRLAEREADLQAAAWTIESLSLRLELAGQSGAVPSPNSGSGNHEAR
jgi:hypothetical protein